MAISITSFLKPSTSPNNHLHLTTNQPTLSSSSWGTNKEEISWRRRCMATMACIVISSGTIGFAGEANSIGVSENSPPAMETALEGKLVKWSDQRRCPPWHANSLESVVPENLPRPSSSLRSDGRASFSFQAAPRILDFVRANGGGCFSL
ncbi:hypothetical protein J5N97_019225 [Dioscorea zingiberensis]|uniref:Uncharacterized protein n=1 Tax=Dioscorea zingiberensis TaxID=325984 RepID=A0A9D5HC38_9LILI|nr:hypothetical protein J5N97_019225 [Dioscorea zingiberensis]